MEKKMTSIQTSSRQIVTVQEVDEVLSALITGPLWDPAGVMELGMAVSALELEGVSWARVLSGIKGWIEGEEEMGNTSNGQASALALIEGIARRKGISIVSSDVDEAGFIRGLINGAYIL